ncbi:GRAM domain-containing protein [Labilibaculum sp. K2S]|uniref:GRAM domain-containing protein n=1 Tax=Labilibaculum sp. K2S TaxID=3056386 RepID=UPI0025A3BB3B|nr:GRAM domain-containing protein [Labilibaculum sp. K2S]MDM8158534.1 GRAM domain-containing protein [Labilibaculum sp. K2S]
MKKLNFKQRIIFVLLSGIPYGIVLLLLNYIFDLYTIKSVLYQTLFFTILFGIGFPFVLEKLVPKMLSKVKNPEMHADETIIFEDGASLFRGALVAVGGKLFLTNKRLIFNPHKYNFQKGETSIELSEITEISKRKTSRIMDNGLRVVTKDNTKYDLVLNDRDEWLKQLKK